MDTTGIPVEPDRYRPVGKNVFGLKMLGLTVLSVLVVAVVISLFGPWLGRHFAWLGKPPAQQLIWLGLALMGMVQAVRVIVTARHEYDPDFGPSINSIRLQGVAMLVCFAALAAFWAVDFFRWLA
jgi:hypothetical protein